MRLLVGFAHRVVYATLFAMLGWYACIMPPESSWQTAIQRLLCYGLTYPPAVIGQLTYPLGGMDLFFTHGSTWCDFCSAQDVFWYHLRFAVPVYVLLFYIPALFKWIARRDKLLFRRIMVALLIYVVMTALFFGLTSDGDRRGDIRVAATWLVILAASSTVAWSNLSLKVKAGGVAAVLLTGAWVLSLLMAFTAPKVDGIHMGFYIAHVFVLIIGVTFVLGMTWVIERSLDRFRERMAHA